MSEVYRLATIEDAERLLHVTYEAYVTIRELELSWPAAHADLALIQDNIKNNECYVLEVDGVIAATITLSKGEEVKAVTDFPFVKWFAVDPAYQGSGLGDKLLTWVEQNIIQGKVGAAAVTLATAEKHPWLLPMYERRGYERIHVFDFNNGDGPMHLLRKIVSPALYESYLSNQSSQTV
ncbi:MULTISPECIES: GNAT family N-acetyltransferase [Bacillales]|uniref:GNAT family N-acetyltransferase n=1 Tax=Bacillales TaxID=1385 RepID=UPI0006A7F07C|nr:MULTISPECIES: GNAT family N-acetyltransferase [Bacillales]OBZ17298.1 acetyltransferase [Bacillus sp. FJAT-26390]